MKSALFFAGLATLALCGCTDPFDSLNPGNPNGAAYAGQPGSVWSSADNPPKTDGVVAYDPNAAPAPALAATTPAAAPLNAPMAPYNPAGPAPRRNTLPR
jgi:hypothetical protein